METRTRRSKMEKRKRNKKLIRIFSILGTVLFLMVIGIWLFGGENEAEGESPDMMVNEEDTILDSPTESDEQSGEINTVEEESNGEESETSHPQGGENDFTENEMDSLQKEEIESDDPLVVEAYVANWQPAGTKQAGPHTINFDDGSQDRIEMRRAILTATNLEENNIIEWWIGRAGDQEVVATVSDKAETEVYRVYLSWIDEQGWQPTKVERLKENDKKS